jgi:hypothetical protein
VRVVLDIPMCLGEKKWDAVATRLEDGRRQFAAGESWDGGEDATGRGGWDALFMFFSLPSMSTEPTTINLPSIRTRLSFLVFALPTMEFLFYHLILPITNIRPSLSLCIF